VILIWNSLKIKLEYGNPKITMTQLEEKVIWLGAGALKEKTVH